MLALLLALLTLVTLAVLRRDGGQVVTAGMLLLNWGLNSAFVYVSGLDCPWTWYLSVDWLTALVLWIDRDTAWQRVLIGTYALELVMHAGFAWVTRDSDPLVWSRTDATLYWRQWWYVHSLTDVAWLQVGITGSWIAYDTVRNWMRARGSVPPAVAGDGAEAGQ